MCPVNVCVSDDESPNSFEPLVYMIDAVTLEDVIDVAVKTPPTVKLPSKVELPPIDNVDVAEPLNTPSTLTSPNEPVNEPLIFPPEYMSPLALMLPATANL